jgi:hypothetical protein
MAAYKRQHKALVIGTKAALVRAALKTINPVPLQVRGQVSIFQYSGPSLT